MKKLNFKLLVLLSLLSLSILFSCKDDSETIVVDNSLYTRLGGSEAITALVNQTITNISTHPTLSSHFSVALGDADEAARLTNSLIVYFTDVTGGPLKYTGFADMQSAHSMSNNQNVTTSISEDDFDAFVNIIAAEAIDLGVPTAELTEVANILNANKTSILSAN